MPAAPLRVAYVLSHFHPHASGAERQALAQGEELVRRGHVVHVVTRHVPGHQGDEVMRGVLVHRWVMPANAGPMFGLSFVSGVVRALLRLRPEIDLVHTHQGLWEAIAAGLARPLLGKRPTLVQPASSGYYGEADELMRTKGASVLRRLILRNTAFAAISTDIERQWRELGVPHAKMHRTVSGVDAERFQPGPSLLEGELPPRPRVLFTGRLHPQKGLDVLLTAWPEVAARTRAHLLLLGAGPERDRLRARAHELGVEGSIHFRGQVAEPAEYLRAADLFVLPSVAEGMSNSLLEALATGLPCLASDIGGNRDLIDHDVSGLLVSVHEPAAWTSAMTNLLEDQDKAGRLGREARRRVEERYALPRVMDDYMDLYHRLLGR